MRSLRCDVVYLTLSGRNTPFVNHVKSLDVIFDDRITWRPHTEMTEVKAFRTIIRIFFLFRSVHLSVNMKLTLYRAHQISNYSAWESAIQKPLYALRKTSFVEWQAMQRCSFIFFVISESVASKTSFNERNR
jgi:hypothetical protein